MIMGKKIMLVVLLVLLISPFANAEMEENYNSENSWSNDDQISNQDCHFLSKILGLCEYDKISKSAEIDDEALIDQLKSIEAEQIQEESRKQRELRKFKLIEHNYFVLTDLIAIFTFVFNVVMTLLGILIFIFLWGVALLFIPVSLIQVKEIITKKLIGGKKK